MNSRLIPWFLATTGFLVAILVLASSSSAWRGGQAAKERAQPSQVARPLALQPIDQEQSASLPGVAQPHLPLPAPAPAGPPGDVQPVPDDEPTVDDLPGRQTPSSNATAEAR
jgi:hypothetical protein